MKKKMIELALIGFASASLILAGCQQAHSEGESSSAPSSDASSISNSDDPGDVPVSHRKIKLTSPKEGETIAITPKPLLDYLSSKTEGEAAKALLEAQKNRDITCTSVKLSWEKDGSANYTVYIDENEDFSDPVEVKVSSLSNVYEAYNLVPNKTYFWKVKGTRSHDISDVSSFKTSGSSVRFVRASNASNIRDLGGWNAEGGASLEYGKLFRGGLLNNYNGYGGLDENGKKVFNSELKIRTEIDLRDGDRNDGEQRECCFDSSKKYIRAQIGQYNRILDPDNYASALGYRSFQDFANDGQQANKFYANDGITVRSLRKIFDALSEESNYPVYFHCDSGADRTGTLAFLLEGLLGVSYEDMVRDYELTSFSKFGDRYRSRLKEDKSGFDDSGVYKDEGGAYIGFGKFAKELLSYYGDGKNDLQLAISNFLTRYVGIPSSQIASFKGIMTGRKEKSITLSTRPEFLLSENESIALSLEEAALDAGSVESISLAGIDLGKDPSNIALSSIKEKNISGERDIVVKAKKDGAEITVYVPVLLITKMIGSADELIGLDTYRKKGGDGPSRLTNYGYYRLSKDIGTVSNPVNGFGGYLSEQGAQNGGFGFRGTLDGNGKAIHVKPQYGGLFSVVGGGAEFKNLSFKVVDYGSTGDAACLAVLCCSLCGASFSEVDFEVVSSGWGRDGFQKNAYKSGVGLISANMAHGNSFKNVSVKSLYPIASIFGGVTYEGLGGSDFDHFTIDCQELCHLGVKRSIGSSGSPIPVSSCYLPMDFKGIEGSFDFKHSESVSVRLEDSYASIEIEKRFGQMELLSAAVDGQAVDDAALEEGAFTFETSKAFGGASSSSPTIVLELSGGGFMCSYSIPVSLSK